MQVSRDYNPRFRQSYRRGSFALFACIYNMLKKIKSVMFFTNFFKKISRSRGGRIMYKKYPIKFEVTALNRHECQAC